MILPQAIFRHAESLRLRTNRCLAGIPPILRHAKEQRPFLIRKYRKLTFNQIQQICPVIAPVALLIHRVGFHFGSGNHRCKEIPDIIQLPVLRFHSQPANGKRAAQDLMRPVLIGCANLFNQFFRIAHLIADGHQNQRIVSVGLQQFKE